jgi:hypothetical protein
MRKVILAVLALAAVASAEKSFFGLGLFGGTAIGHGEFGGGAHGRMWLDQTNAVDITLNVNGKGMSVGGEYKINNYDTFQASSGRVPWYYGIGGSLFVGGDVGLGINIPIGVSYEFAGAPLDVFAESGVGVGVSDGSFYVPIKLGAHFYF